jgi:PAS domain S-box-containing protein
VQLSQTIRDQSDQLKETNSLLVFGMVGAFAVYFVTIYFLVFRRTFRSITKLHDGTKIIGSGNLDYSIAAKSNDEIGELSRAFNQMTTSLKTVTASKTDLEQAQASLRESEQRWATTLASIGDAVIATDISGKVMFMNAKAEELTGWTLDEVAEFPSKKVFNIINEKSRLEVENPIEKVLRDGVVVGLANHTILIRKNGSEIPIDDSGAPIRDEEGKTTGVVLIFRDITERKKAEDNLRGSEERFSKAFHGSPVPQIITRVADFRYIDANESVLRLLEYSREELVGHSSDELNLLVDKNKRDQGIRVVREQGELSDFETNVRTKSGKMITVLTSSEAINLNGQKHLINTFIDVTLRKQMQAKLEEYSKHLEGLVEERTKQLKDSERLATIGATAGMVGHDIRNPLQAITGDLYLAKTELATLPENEQKADILENLDEIQKNIDYVNKIVADLQDYSRSLNPRAQETDIKSVLTEILDKNDVPKNVKVEVKVEDKAEKVMADPDYLKRIAANLTLNAVQAMPNGGKLTIHVYADKKTNDVLITVKDTGVGIPEDIKPKLFTPMMTTKSKGQGFGLAVVKRMTESLGGTVTFESQEGKGTTFIVRLPPPKELNGKWTFKGSK